MAKTSARVVRRRPNPSDLTLRNLHAMKARILRLELIVDELLQVKMTPSPSFSRPRRRG